MHFLNDYVNVPKKGHWALLGTYFRIVHQANALRTDKAGTSLLHKIH